MKNIHIVDVWCICNEILVIGGRLFWDIFWGFLYGMLKIGEDREDNFLDDLKICISYILWLIRWRFAYDSLFINCLFEFKVEEKSSEYM